jgi:hypothetical protein
MTIRERLFKDFNVDLPITGGVGNSIDDPVILEIVDPIDDFIDTEYLYLKLIGIGRGIEWKFMTQFLMEHENKKIDKIQIETIQQLENETITQIENIYFDITDCFKKKYNE